MMSNGLRDGEYHGSRTQRTTLNHQKSLPQPLWEQPQAWGNQTERRENDQNVKERHEVDQIRNWEKGILKEAHPEYKLEDDSEKEDIEAEEGKS